MKILVRGMFYLSDVKRGVEGEEIKAACGQLAGE